MLVPLFFNQNVRDTFQEINNVLIIVVAFLILLAALVFADLLLKMKYREYKFNYIMFYSVDFLKRHCADEKIPIHHIPKEDVDKIVQQVSLSTDFDKRDIKDALYTYYHRILRIYPGWLESEIGELTQKNNKS
jgi:hypothetical protein